MSLGVRALGNPQEGMLESFPGSGSVSNEEGKAADRALADFFGLSKMPSKKYHYLTQLQEKGVKCRYTPFIQGGLAEILSPQWKGSCEILSYTWMIRKAQLTDLSEPVFYPIHAPYLPHPMMIGSQNENETDFIQSSENPISMLQDLLISAKKSDMIYFQACNEDLSTNIDCYLSQLQAYDAHASSVSSCLFHSNFKMNFGHTCGFIKKEDTCSWFDPNYGEIFFTRFEDFAQWFRSEALDGSLRYFFFLEKSETNKISVGSLFPIPEITEEEMKEKQENPGLLEPIYQKYQEAGKARSQQMVSMISHPTISTFLLEKDIPLTIPEELQDLCFV